MEDNWDLHAVVRGRATSAATITTETTSCSLDFQPPSIFDQPQEDHFIFFPDLFEPRISETTDDLYDLFKPFFPKSPLSVLGGSQDLPPPPPKSPQKREKQLQNHSVSHTPSPRSKRRKNQVKRVCEVPAEGLSSDFWSWRKYGQKPIKGSPYPRGYYKCSSSKGCLARRQVERSRSDPVMFIVTYTADHNHPMPTHRNSLAGITRQKPVPGQTSSGTTGPSCSPPVSPESGEERESDQDDEYFAVSDMVTTDDIFECLEEIAGPATGDCFSDQFPASMQSHPESDSLTWA